MNHILKHEKIIVVCLLLVLFVFELFSALQENQTLDEGVHLAAGYSYWITGDFRMNPEHPPLLKELAAVPLLFLKNKLIVPTADSSWSQPNEWQFARKFLYSNTVPAETILLLGRLPLMLLSICFALFVYRCSREFFGVAGGLISLVLFCFSPDMIAHSRYVTTDIGISFFFFATIYYFYKYLSTQRTRFKVLTILFFCLSVASKYSAVILIPILPLEFVIYHLIYEKKFNLKFSWKKAIGFFAVLFGCAFVFIWSTYFFQFKKPIEDIEVRRMYALRQEIVDTDTLGDWPPLVQKVIHWTDPQTTSGRLFENFVTKTPIPAYWYIRGTVQVFGHNYGGHTAYLMGHFSDFGWWYYFPLAFLIKEPLALLVLLFLTGIYTGYRLVIRVRQRKNKPLSITELHPWVYLSATPCILYLLWSMSSHLNLGIRHIYILFPFMFVGLGVIATIDMAGKKIVKAIIISLLVLYCLSSVQIYPHFLAYFNELIGGPDSGPKYLVDSNIDWGQDLSNLKKYMTTNGIDHVCLSYFGQGRIEYFGIDYWYLPDNANFHGIDSVNCVVAISATSLYSEDHPYSWLLAYPPTTKIGYSIYVYDFRHANSSR